MKYKEEELAHKLIDCLKGNTIETAKGALEFATVLIDRTQIISRKSHSSIRPQRGASRGKAVKPQT